MKNLFLLYILILLPACSATYMNEQNLAQADYGMGPIEVSAIFNNHGMLKELDATELGEYKCISYNIKHNDYSQLSLAYLNGKLANANFGSDCQEQKSTNSKKIEFNKILDSWVYPKEKRRLNVSEIFIAPFILLAQLGTKDPDNFLDLNAGMSMNQFVSKFGKPHCKSSIDDSIEIIGYDTTRGFTRAGYTIYFTDKKSTKIDYGLICNGS